MIKTLITAGSVAANTNLPLTLLYNTNPKTELGTNTVKLKAIGLWEAKANVVFTATTTGNVSLKLLADGNAIPGADYTMTVASGDTYTYTINDVLRTIPAISGNVELSLQFDQAVTIVSGDFIAEYVR